MVKTSTRNLLLTPATVAVGLVLWWGAGLFTAGAAELRIPSPGLPTLATGVRTAREGDTLLLGPGLHHGPVVIDKGITLTPGQPGVGQVIVDGGGKGRVLEIRAPGVTVSGLTLRNSGDDIEETDSCIYVRSEAAGTVLMGNMLEQCLFGIWINGAANPRIEGNRVSGIARPIASDMGNGIHLWHVNGGIVKGNLVRRVRDGIYLSVSTGTLVQGNLMHDLRFGLHYMYNDRNRVIGNVGCRAKVGMALMFSKKMEIRGNLVINNEQQGIVFRTILDSEIVDNRVENNGKGFFLNDSSFNVLRGNHLEGNRIGVHLTAGSEDNQVHGNNFVANQVQVRFSWSKAIPWDDGREGNYWSDYLGWDLDRDGLGDRIHYPTHRLDTLIFRYPQMKMLAASPVVRLLQGLESRMPVLRPAGIVDRHPAIQPFPTPARPPMKFPGAELVGAVCAPPRPPAAT